VPGHVLTTRDPSPALDLEAGADATATERRPASFVEVFQAHAGTVMGLLRRLGVAQADVEDVAQEVFVTIHHKLPGFEGRSTLKTWVCGICLRKAKEYRRRTQRRRETPTAVEPVAHAAGGPEACTAEHEWMVLLQRALAALPEKQREVFVLYELEELEMAEVARAVGCPRFTAYTRLHSARRKIRAHFAAADAPRARRRS